MPAGVAVRLYRRHPRLRGGRRLLATLPRPVLAHTAMALSLSSPGELTQLLRFSERRLTADEHCLFCAPDILSPDVAPASLCLKTQTPASCPVPSSSPADRVGCPTSSLEDRKWGESFSMACSRMAPVSTYAILKAAVWGGLLRDGPPP